MPPSLRQKMEEKEGKIFRVHNGARHENQRTSQKKKKRQKKEKEMKLLSSVMLHRNPSNTVFSANTGICRRVYSFRSITLLFSV
jgi:hypothetical protein